MSKTGAPECFETCPANPMRTAAVKGETQRVYADAVAFAE
jgi:hypothetical protein